MTAVRPPSVVVYARTHRDDVSQSCKKGKIVTLPLPFMSFAISVSSPWVVVGPRQGTAGADGVVRRACCNVMCLLLHSLGRALADPPVAGGGLGCASAARAYVHGVARARRPDVVDRLRLADNRLRAAGAHGHDARPSVS